MRTAKLYPGCDTADVTAHEDRLTPSVAASVAETAQAIAREVMTAVEVRAETLEHLLVCLLAEGHVLIEDLPGVGKTALARALAQTIDLEFARVQCTSDLLPAEVVGTSIYSSREEHFEFRPGPIFANVVLVDEINRASPKTQSGLLECMAERRVTVDGHTHVLALPFLVVATQNPVDFEGTYPLPEAQLDRFMARIALGYPSAEAEAQMLATHDHGDRVADVRMVASAADVAAMLSASERVYVSDALRAYIVALLTATRVDDRCEVGASPRAGLMLMRAAKARALLHGRDHALPDDVQALARPLLAHRIAIAPAAAYSTTADEIVDAAVAAVSAL